MITNVVIDYLKNKDVPQENKSKFLHNLNLSYSDIFELKEFFGYDYQVHATLHDLSYYRDSKFEEKMKKHRREEQRIQKIKRMKKKRREYNYD